MARKLEGLLIERKSGRRFAGATIRLEPAAGTEGGVFLCSSNADGTFAFDIDALQEGSYMLAAYDPECGPKLYPKKVSIGSDRKVLIDNRDAVKPLMLEIEPRHMVSNKAGVVFLFIILGLLFGLAIFYINLHRTSKPLAPQIINPIIEQVEEVKAAVEGTESPDFIAARPKIVQLQEHITLLKNYGLIEKDRIKYMEYLFDEIIRTLDKEDVDRKAIINQLDYANTLIREQVTYFWQDSPLRFLEMLFWAVAATLIRLAMNAGAYIYRGSFHTDAIPQHIGYLFSVPIMAVLIAFVLSFVNIDFKLGESGISFDLSHVTASIVIAALVGLAPWRASEFLGNLADLFFEKLGRLFGIAKNEEETIQQDRTTVEAVSSAKEPRKKPSTSAETAAGSAKKEVSGKKGATHQKTDER